MAVYMRRSIFAASHNEPLGRSPIQFVQHLVNLAANRRRRQPRRHPDGPLRPPLDLVLKPVVRDDGEPVICVLANNYILRAVDVSPKDGQAFPEVGVKVAGLNHLPMHSQPQVPAWFAGRDFSTGDALMKLSRLRVEE